MSKSDDLWQAIYALNCLLEDDCQKESEYQAFFEMNPVVFFALGVDRALSFEKSSGRQLPHNRYLGFRPEPDFLGVSESSGVVWIIELKTPVNSPITSKIKVVGEGNGKRRVLRKDAVSYISQAIEYQKSISGDLEAKNIVQSAFGIEGISGYKIVIVYGRGSRNDRKLVSELCRDKAQHLEIVFYDDLLSKMKSLYCMSRTDITPRPGWCLIFHLLLLPDQEYKKSYIGEFGGDQGISFFLESGDLVFECVDSRGVVHRLVTSLTTGVPHFVLFELSNDSNGICMSLNVDNIERDIHVCRRQMDFEPDREAFTFGAKVDGTQGASFLVHEILITDTSIGVEGRLIAFRNFSRLSPDDMVWLQFLPKCYLTLVNGTLVQDHEELKPCNYGVFRSDCTP